MSAVQVAACLADIYAGVCASPGDPRLAIIAAALPLGLGDATRTSTGIDASRAYSLRLLAISYQEQR